jgi:hypothetical protein
VTTQVLPRDLRAGDIIQRNDWIGPFPIDREYVVVSIEKQKDPIRQGARYRMVIELADANHREPGYLLVRDTCYLQPTARVTLVRRPGSEA